MSAEVSNAGHGQGGDQHQDKGDDVALTGGIVDAGAAIVALHKDEPVLLRDCVASCFTLIVADRIVQSIKLARHITDEATNSCTTLVNTVRREGENTAEKMQTSAQELRDLFDKHGREVGEIAEQLRLAYSKLSAPTATTRGVLPVAKPNSSSSSSSTPKDASMTNDEQLAHERRLLELDALAFYAIVGCDDGKLAQMEGDMAKLQLVADADERMTRTLTLLVQLHELCTTSAANLIASCMLSWSTGEPQPLPLLSGLSQQQPNKGAPGKQLPSPMAKRCIQASAAGTSLVAIEKAATAAGVLTGGGRGGGGVLSISSTTGLMNTLDQSLKRTHLMCSSRLEIRLLHIVGGIPAMSLNRAGKKARIDTDVQLGSENGEIDALTTNGDTGNDNDHVDDLRALASRMNDDGRPLDEDMVQEKALAAAVSYTVSLADSLSKAERVTLQGRLLELVARTLADINGGYTTDLHEHARVLRRGLHSCADVHAVASTVATVYQQLDARLERCEAELRQLGYAEQAPGPAAVSQWQLDAVASPGPSGFGHPRMAEGRSAARISSDLLDGDIASLLKRCQQLSLQLVRLVYLQQRHEASTALAAELASVYAETRVWLGRNFLAEYRQHAVQDIRDDTTGEPRTADGTAAKCAAQRAVRGKALVDEQ